MCMNGEAINIPAFFSSHLISRLLSSSYSISYISGTLSLCFPVSAIEMATPHPFFVFFFSLLFISVAAATKDQTSCTMCYECSNPCLPNPPPLPPSLPPPPPSPPPVPDCPPPPEPGSICPPPPPDVLQLPPPHPPIEGCGGGGCVGGGGGGGEWYPPRFSAPNPVLPYFPYYDYAHPLPRSLSNSAHFRNHPVVSSIFLCLSFFYP